MPRKPNLADVLRAKLGYNQSHRKGKPIGDYNVTHRKGKPLPQASLPESFRRRLGKPVPNIPAGVTPTKPQGPAPSLADPRSSVVANLRERLGRPGGAVGPRPGARTGGPFFPGRKPRKPRNASTLSTSQYPR